MAILKTYKSNYFPQSQSVICDAAVRVLSAAGKLEFTLKLRTFSLKSMHSTMSPSPNTYTAVRSEKTDYSVHGKPSNTE